MNSLSDFNPHGDSVPLSVDASPDQSSTRERLHLGKMTVDTSTPDEFVDHVLHAAFDGTSTHLVATANAQFYVLANSNPKFAEILRTAEFVCADGVSIVAACRVLTGRTVERIPGVDLISRLCAAGASRSLRIFLLGGTPGAASATAALLLERHPGIQVVGVECPPFGFEKNEVILGELLGIVRAAKPHIIFVGLGCPKQEFFIHDHLRALAVPVAIGTGGSFDMYSGRLKRAPQWIQDIGLEWCFRLVQEPSRLWRRYLIGNVVFCYYVLREFVRRPSPPPSDSRPE